MPLPVISVVQMRAWEAASWKAGRSEREVIERVGKMVAQQALTMSEDGDTIVVLAGKGHNGDDARAAVAHLLNRDVKLVEVSDPGKALEEVGPLFEKHPRVVIDGLFGIGLNRALSADWVKLIEKINAAKLKVLSIDVPSGLNAATGRAEGAAVEAAVTLTVGAVKRGFLAESAWNFVGRLEVATEIGLVEMPAEFAREELQWTEAKEFEAYGRSRSVNSHKGTYGHAAILAGSLGYHGAAVLAARGAEAAHPGLVSLFTQAEVYLPVAAQLLGTMVHPWPAMVRPDEICTALVAGPGLASVSLSQDFKTIVTRFWRSLRQPMIVDASALDWLEASATIDGVRVVTPHPGEAARMLGVTTKEVQADRVGAVRKISEKFGNCWVVLKGHQSLIGRAKGPVYVNSSGNPFMAQGGTGDVLAGFLAGVLAQPELQKDVGYALRFGVWAHGNAADKLSAKQGRWVVEELPAELSVVGPR